jgi:Na+/melibiose symporter-like transporter
LQAKEHTASFFAAYFISGALGLPCWIMLTKRIGVKRTWELSMLVSIVCFCGVSRLGNNDQFAFYLICISSGFALGADLALPPVLLAQIVPRETAISAYFGIWTLFGKLALALAGLSYSILAFFNFYHTSSPTEQSKWTLISLYALLPCVLKLCAFLTLYWTKNEKLPAYY